MGFQKVNTSHCGNDSKRYDELSWDVNFSDAVCQLSRTCAMLLHWASGRLHEGVSVVIE